MKKVVRGLLIAAGVLVGVAVLLIGGWLVLTRMSFPPIRGTVRVAGISAPVTIERDRYGVPHIYARTSADLFFAEGYVHAEDRFWQMEMSRRIGEGRLSELFGKSQLQNDVFLRTLGIARIARAEFKTASPRLKAALEAYSNGVNAYIRHRSPARLGLEFAILNLTGVKTKIEPWTPVNTLEWAKMMALGLADSWGEEVFMMHLLHTLGRRGLPDFFTPYRKEMPVTVSNKELGSLARRNLSRPLAVTGSVQPNGSNEWVISGRLTATGKPILANDQHLDEQIPAIWYEVGLQCVDADGHVGPTKECPYDLYGFSLPGAPGVVTGHNDRIAWGITDLNGSLQDLYLERINPDNPDQYLSGGQWKNMTFIYQEIPVRKAKEPYRLRVRMTRDGPIISDHGRETNLQGFLSETKAPFPENVELTAVALKWAGLQPSQTVGAELALDRAENYRQFRAALSRWTSPALNFVYADVEGNIAFQTAGRVPIRIEGGGEAPLPGWSSAFDWKGFIPFDKLPHLLNPAKGYIVNANNPPAGSAYPYFFGNQLAYGYRARRIVRMILSRKAPIGIADVEKMQADNLNYTAHEVIAALKGLDLHPTLLERQIAAEKEKGMSAKHKAAFDRAQREMLPRLEQARKLLLSWDDHMSGDSAPAALYAFFWEQLVTAIFRDQYPESDWPMGGYALAENAVHYLLAEPHNRLWDDVTTPQRETRDEILVLAFRRGYEALVAKEGRDPKKWRWNKLHTITFVNQSLGRSGIYPIERIFNRGPYPIGSGATQVNEEGWNRKKPFKDQHIPSMREIVDLANLGASLSILPTGESGHPGNRHYADFIHRWLMVRYHPMMWRRAKVDRTSDGKLTLYPAESPGG